MTEQEQRIAIAEACGWQIGRLGQLYKPGSVTVCGWLPQNFTMFPDYLKDLNAMFEAEKVLNDGQAVSYGSELDKLTVNHNYYWHATAAQRAEAFLRTIGKWKEAE